jgi:hypothetical protein
MGQFVVRVLNVWLWSFRDEEVGQRVRIRLVQIIQPRNCYLVVRQLLKLILEAVYPDWPKSPSIPAAYVWVARCMLEWLAI